MGIPGEKNYVQISGSFMFYYLFLLQCLFVLIFIYMVSFKLCNIIWHFVIPSALVLKKILYLFSILGKKDERSQRQYEKEDHIKSRQPSDRSSGRHEERVSRTEGKVCLLSHYNI